MANITTVTRPYAKAILALAKADNAYAQWSEMLNFLAMVAQDPDGYKMLGNLAILPIEKADFICDVGKGILNEQGQNLVKLLALGKRLLILPELYNVYEDMRKQTEHMVTIDFTLAQDLDQAEYDQIKLICDKKFTGQIILSEKIDPELISGGVAKIGNRVIDASIMGRLQAMRNLLRK